MNKTERWGSSGKQGRIQELYLGRERSNTELGRRIGSAGEGIARRAGRGGGNCAAAAEAEGCGRCSMPLHLYYKSGNSGTEPYIVAHDLVTAGLDEAGIKHLGDRVAGEEEAIAMSDGKP